jgi:foldase protein PrsA
MVVKRWWGLSVLLLVLVALLPGCSSTPEAVDDTPVSPVASAPLPVPTAQPGAVPTKSLDQSLEVALESMQRYQGQTLVTVNGQEITWDEYEPALERALANVTRQYSLNWDDPAMQQRLAHFQDDVLQSMIDQLLLEQMAEQDGIAITDAELERRVQEEKARVVSSSQSADWDAFLEGSGYTEEEFKQFVADRILVEALLAAQDVDSTAEHVHISHIFVTDESMAQTILAELNSGRTFAELATQYSEDPSTKDQGGEVGWFARGSIDPAVEEVAFSLTAGQFGGPVKIEGGYLLIQVTGREVRELDPQLIQQSQTNALQARLEAERASARIDYLVDFLAGGNG